MSNAAHEHICPPFMARWLNSPLRKLFQNPRKIFSDYVKPGDTVVDLGCGGGYFTAELAKMTGGNGKVIAVDMQEEVLKIARDFASKNGFTDNIIYHKCSENEFGLSDMKADFALAFYVVHEVPDRKRFLRQAAELLKPEGYFMIVEPKLHVSGILFDEIMWESEARGMRLHKSLKVFGSRGAVFVKSK